ncbi:hypothetical protein L2E82_37870 [Cichorium intybus]|uniref:Uncharacterized protein n=1 Tax=Cichorium intybus TaxID=13427 RepID=A0ACB9AFV3_CICIN|nr:hypothetical protein L2E82_37870 [Cichorium intybus]
MFLSPLLSFVLVLLDDMIKISQILPRVATDWNFVENFQASVPDKQEKISSGETKEKRKFSGSSCTSNTFLTGFHTISWVQSALWLTSLQMIFGIVAVVAKFEG